MVKERVFQHFCWIVFTATSVTSFISLSPDGFCLSLLCFGRCFSGGSTNVLLAVSALFDLLFVILFSKGVPEEAEEL